MPESLNIGGQAVLEGVMMRSPHAFTVAVRKGGKPGADIALLRETIVPIGERYPLFKIKIIRGSVALFEALWLGIRALNFSANEAIEDIGGKKEEIGDLAMAGTMLTAIAFSLGLFLALPLLLTNLLGAQFGALKGNVLFNLTDGALRVALFLGYVSGISFMKDIRRVFEYHGAEHKAIAAHEAGVALTAENARPFSRIHPRCGTSFLLVVMLVSIFVFALLGKPETWGDRLERFAMIPVIGGISYEFIRLSAKEKFARFLKPAVWPGLTLQKVTTAEPSDDMLEVAIAALEACLDYQNVALKIPANS